MKNILFLFILSLVSLTSFAQEIPQKANTIVITLTDSSNIRQKVTDVLTKKDYTVKPAKKSTTVISTDAKTIKNNTRVSLNADVKGAEIILSGSIVPAAQSSMRIEYKGAKGTPIMNAWEEMDKVAKAFGGTVKYEVR